MSAALPVAGEFDFWLGEWAVQNRILDDSGEWVDSDTARVRIAPFLDGLAVFEEWAGPFFGATMQGFSIRSYDVVKNEWHLVLFWTTSGDGGFSELRGQFRHGRGEFFSHDAGVTTRYTFSDISALPGTSATSLRWDQATSSEAGVWRTDWIMEFVRQADAPADSKGVFDQPWSGGATHESSGGLPFRTFLGEWSGKDNSGREVELSCTTISAGALVVGLIRVFDQASGHWHETLFIAGFVAMLDEWQCWTATKEDPTLRSGTVSIDSGITGSLSADSNGTNSDGTDSDRADSDGVNSIRITRDGATWLGLRQTNDGLALSFDGASFDGDSIDGASTEDASIDGADGPWGPGTLVELQRTGTGAGSSVGL